MERTDMIGRLTVSPNFLPFSIGIEMDAEEDWEWLASDEFTKPHVDDLTLRQAAQQVQSSLGSHKALESEGIASWLGDPEDLSWSEEVSEAPVAESNSLNGKVLLERVVMLGPMALELLRYFSDNPGDSAAHAEQILGHSASDIKRLLVGSLGYYVKRSSSGGWECHSWTSDILAVLDENSH